MLKKNDFFRNFTFDSGVIKKNYKKTKKAFELLKTDFLNFEIPLLNCYEKDYIFDFSKKLVNKFSKFENIILIGMGGSILGTKAIHSFFKEKIKKKIFFFDNLDQNLYLEYKKIKNLKNSCFVVVSKSGNTLEVIANLSVIFSKSLLKKKLIFITENKNNFLMNIANKYEADIIEHKEFIGGRYSVLSEVGMFPASIMNLKIKNFQNLEKLLKNKNFVSCLLHNVTCLHTLEKNNVKTSVFLSYDSKLNDLCYWYQQLIGESLGKKGKGFTPIVSLGPKDHHSILQLYLDGPKDKFFTFFNFENTKGQFKIKKNIISDEMKFLKNKNIKNLVKSQMNATKNVFKLKKIPFRQINFKKNNEEELGTVFTFFVLETILLSSLMDVNPYDQPSVELVKNETRKILLR